MILTILILLGIGLAVYTCILHSIGPILGILLAVGYTLGCIIVFLLLVALLFWLALPSRVHAAIQQVTLEAGLASTTGS